jgi:predicted MPP superfamily phosphohydrolase/tetratricopeptide (TPR) repeat protein
MSQWLQILHVSDLHFGHGDATTRFDQQLVTEGIVHDAAKLAKELGPPELIVVTGDIAFSANAANEYPKAEAWLRLLAQRTNPKARVLMVPGNHDVDRKKAVEFPFDFVHKGLRDKPGGLDGLFEQPDKMRGLWSKLEAYAQFANAFGCTVTHERPFAVQTFTTPLGPVTAALLNTALLSFDNDDDPANLYLGQAQLLEAISRASSDSLLLVLQHHPTSWLKDGANLRAAAAQKPALLFSGHVHEQNAMHDVSLLSRGVFEFPSGAGHGEQEGEHSYAWIRLSADELQYYPRSWSRKNMTFLDSANDSEFKRLHPVFGKYSAYPRQHLPETLRRWLLRDAPQPKAKSSLLMKALERAGERRPRSGRRIDRAEPYIPHPYPLESNFTGRLHERAVLTAWLGEANRPCFVVSAMGGMGKSALTWHWLRYDVLPSARFDGVIWWSFYETNAQFNTFVQRAIVYAATDRPRETQNAFERTRRLAETLNNRRLLIVLDGYEREMIAYAGQSGAYQGDDLRTDERRSVNDSIDPNAASFFRWIGDQARSKLLITSRLFPSELLGADDEPRSGCGEMRLTGLQPDDAVAFLRSQGVRGSREDIDAACARYANHPLSLRLLSGLVRNDFKHPGDIAAAGAGVPIGDLVARQHHILQVSFDALVGAPRELLGKIAVHRGPVPYTAMQTFGMKDVDTHLHTLQDRGLIDFDQVTKRFDLHPIVRHFAYDRLVDKKSASESARNYYATVPVPEVSAVTGIEQVDPLLELFHHTVLAGDVVDGFRLLRDRLMPVVYYRLGNAQRFLEVLQHLWQAATQNALPGAADRWVLKHGVDLVSWTMNALGVAYNRAGEPERAATFFEELARQDRPFAFQYLGTTLAHLGETQAAMGRLATAKTTLSAAAHRQGLRDPRDVFVSLRARIPLARLLFLLGDGPAADAMMQETMAEFQKTEVFSRDGAPNFDRNRFIGQTRAVLAQCLADRNPRAALKQAAFAEDAAKRSAVELDLAQAEIVTGSLLAAQDDHDGAIDRLHSALTRARNGGTVNVEIRARLTLANVLLGRTGAMTAETRKSIEEQFTIAGPLIEAGPYRVYAVDLEILRARYDWLTGRPAEALGRLKPAEEAAEQQFEVRYELAIAEIARLRKEMRA